MRSAAIRLFAGATLAALWACDGSFGPDALEGDQASPASADAGAVTSSDPSASLASWAASEPKLLFWLSTADGGVATDGSDEVREVVDRARPSLALRVPDATLAAAGPRLVPGAMNGKPALRFEHERRASLEMSGGFDSLTDEVTIALVVRAAGTSARGRFVSFGADLVDEEVGLNHNDVLRAVRASSGADYAYVDHAETAQAPQIVVMAFGSAPDALDFYVDGERAASAPQLAGSPRALGYVARDLRLSPLASPADFDLGELLVVRRRLDEREILSLSQTLGAKWSVAVHGTVAADAGPSAVRFRDVLSVMGAHQCTACHFPASATGAGVDLTTYAGASAVVVPGAPDKSRLVLALDRMGDKPGATKLTASESALVASWIAEGARE